MAVKDTAKHITTAASEVPHLNSRQWNVLNVLGILLLAMAVLQVVSFKEFKDVLSALGLAGPSAWGVAVIVAEVWGAVGFFKVRMTYLTRLLSAVLALAVSGFWFVENLQVISIGKGEFMNNSGFFGRFIRQTPGWWTVVEATILLLWVLYSLDLVRNSLNLPKRRQ